MAMIIQAAMLTMKAGTGLAKNASSSGRFNQETEDI